MTKTRTPQVYSVHTSAWLWTRITTQQHMNAFYIQSPRLQNSPVLAILRDARLAPLPGVAPDVLQSADPMSHAGMGRSATLLAVRSSIDSRHDPTEERGNPLC